MGRDCAVVAGDAALRAGLVTVEGLLTQVALVSPHQGRGRALAAVLAMDAKAESVGESRTRLVLLDLGLAHESQVVITDPFGQFLARVDFLVEGVVPSSTGRGSTSEPATSRTGRLEILPTFYGWRSDAKTASAGVGTPWSGWSGAS